MHGHWVLKKKYEWVEWVEVIVYYVVGMAILIGLMVLATNYP